MKKADNFDASKWLTENKITTQSRLNEETMMIPSSLVSRYVNMKSYFDDKAGDPTIKAKLIPIITDFFPKNQDVSFQELEDKFGEETARQTIQVLFGAYLAGALDSYQKPISRIYREYKQIRDERDEVKGLGNLNEVTYNLETGEYEEDSPKNKNFTPKELDDFIQKGLQADRTIKAQNQNKPPQETDWNELDMDFSDSDTINFGKFEIDIDRFKQGSKDGYVIDDDGVKRNIDKSTLKSILQSYRENWG